ncbi:hypothetical protein JJD41_08495 [Oxynema sp. CENA135]|uniref:hypothetical protein n=1 Tax=Oxynema sp. CENA135 TaxID=984206 RepID=UPI00190A59CD|nr:hypothetical protein [Oxynema sp. CENA135]MBK4729900.1 hypothetical protein [Oxynema sp. CENA135]
MQPTRLKQEKFRLPPGAKPVLECAFKKQTNISQLRHFFKRFSLKSGFWERRRAIASRELDV